MFAPAPRRPHRPSRPGCFPRENRAPLLSSSGGVPGEAQEEARQEATDPGPPRAAHAPSRPVLPRGRHAPATARLTLRTQSRGPGAPPAPSPGAGMPAARAWACPGRRSEGFYGDKSAQGVTPGPFPPGPREHPVPIQAGVPGRVPQTQAKPLCSPSARPVGTLGAAPGSCQHRPDQQKAGIADPRWTDFPKRDTSPVSDSRPKGTPSLPKARHCHREDTSSLLPRDGPGGGRPPADPGMGRPRHRPWEDRKAPCALGKHRPQEADSASLGKARPLESRRQSA